MTRRVLTLLVAAFLPAVALAADDRAKGWALTVWPNAGLLAEQAADHGQFVLRQSFSCVRGDPTVTWRTYHPAGQPHPAGARRGCDAQCRTELTVTQSDGPRPAGFTERRADWSELREDALQQARRSAVEFASACKLGDMKGRDPDRARRPSPY